MTQDQESAAVARPPPCDCHICAPPPWARDHKRNVGHRCEEECPHWDYEDQYPGECPCCTR